MRGRVINRFPSTFYQKETMRNYAVVVATAVLVSLVAVSQARFYETPVDEVAPYSIVDSIVKAILENLRPKLANIKIADINKDIKSPSLNATIRVNDIVVKNADKFVIKTLKSNALPLKLSNLTLTWDEINAKAAYDVNSYLALGQYGPFHLFGKGKANAALKNVFFTIGANMELKDKAIQIKPKGLFGFDLSIKKADVTLSSLMGSTELGNAVGTFVSKLIPDLVDTLKKPVFDALHDDIVKFVNQILKKNGTSFLMDEEPALPELSFDSLDLSEEMDNFNNPLDLLLEDSSDSDF